MTGRQLPDSKSVDTLFTNVQLPFANCRLAESNQLNTDYETVIYIFIAVHSGNDFCRMQILAP